MAAATLSPSAKQFFWNVTTGAPLANGLVYTVTSGGAYPGNAIATYQDSNALIPNGNPIQLNAAGYATIYLQPGKTYKYLVYDSGGLAGGTLQYSQDGIEATPTTTTGLDAVGTAGEAFTAGQVGYLSDGTGGKTPGLFYLGDSANTYSSTLPAIVAVATVAIASGSTGVFRQGGIVSGLSGLTAGAKYYIGTTGALTATAPANSRQVGVADNTTTQLDIAPAPALSNAVLVSPTISTSVITPASAPLFYGCAGGRLTLTTAVPVTSTDVTAAPTVFWTPYSASPFAGNIGLYDGTTNWTILPFTEISIALGTITSGLPYDIFAYNNSGVVTLRTPVAWTNGTTRATALTLQNGIYVKTGALTDRYLGTFYTTSTTTTEDSAAKRLLYNYYNRVARPMLRKETTDTWAYGTAAFRQANGSAANQLAVMQGVAEDGIDVTVYHGAYNTAGGALILVSIGEDATNAKGTNVMSGQSIAPAVNNMIYASAYCSTIPTVGYHFYAWLEYDGNASASTVWVGDNGGALLQTGIFGMWRS